MLIHVTVYLSTLPVEMGYDSEPLYFGSEVDRRDFCNLLKV